VYALEDEEIDFLAKTNHNNFDAFKVEVAVNGSFRLLETLDKK
jgi:hypothetical protein